MLLICSGHVCVLRGGGGREGEREREGRDEIIYCFQILIAISCNHTCASVMLSTCSSIMAMPWYPSNLDMTLKWMGPTNFS